MSCLWAGVALGLTLMGPAGSHCSAQPSGVASAPLPPLPPKVTRFFPLSEIHAGQTGVAYTVFEGVTPEPMRVKILGVLKNSMGPGRDLILARLQGSKPDYTGVVAGMSGSPVYIDGRLAGALSYRIGQFSKQPIAGITPIQEMLDVRDTPAAPAQETPKATGEHNPEVQPMETPLMMSGFSQQTIDRFGDRFRALGLTPVAGLGGADDEAKQPEPLIPGSAVSAILVRGDLTMAGTCTVTYVDPKRLLACGHPITQSGPVSMPMTKATVVTTLASPLNSFKIVNTTQTVGAFTEDRASAILGQFALKARMIPVTVEVVPVTGPSAAKTYHFQVIDDRQLTPAVMLTSVYQTIQSTDAAAAEQSYRLTGELDVQGEPSVQLGGIMAPTQQFTGAISTALYINDRFTRVYNNQAHAPVVTGLTLHLKAIPERLTAVIESARLSRNEAQPGDSLEVEVTLQPYHAAEKIVRISITLPRNLEPGEVRIAVSDGAILDRIEAPTPALVQHDADLTDTIGNLNRDHPNDSVYVTLLEHLPQAVLASGTLPEIPLSMANIMQPLRDSHQMTLSGESAVELGSRNVETVVSGSQVLHLSVR